jgi:hypothetical protein
MIARISPKMRNLFWTFAFCLVTALAAPSARAAQMTAASETPVTQEQRLDCSRLTDSLDWFCYALDRRNCGVADRSHYWFCKAISERNCNLAERSDYWECRALTERQCNYADTDRYWLCKAFTEDCALAPIEQRDFCYAIAPVYRGREPWVPRE